MNTRIANCELCLGLGAWVTFILATCAYCLVYQAFVAAVTPDLPRTVTVALREWGAWALLAPWALAQFRQRLPRRDVLLCAFGLALLAACLPIFIDQLTADRDFVASLALFWPRNLAMAAGLLLIARVTARRPTATSEAAPTQPKTLLVSKGADQCLIRVDDIQHLSAAGNYVDIRAANQNYLMRSTIGDLQAQLPGEHFVRIHRSHIVRVREIERIRIERSGSGTVHLRGGVTLAISRSHRAQLKAARQSNHPGA
jgi:hypothetical protein